MFTVIVYAVAAVIFLYVARFDCPEECCSLTSVRLVAIYGTQECYKPPEEMQNINSPPTFWPVYFCLLNETKNSAGCHSAPNQNHANHEQEKTKQNTKSLFPTQFLQTQDVPLGKHQQQNTFSQKSPTAERQKQKQSKLSEKKLLKLRNKTLQRKIWSLYWRFFIPDSRGGSLTSGSPPKNSLQTIFT